jgi:glycosyltransferase involved in cell wall biosynthesis
MTWVFLRFFRADVLHETYFSPFRVAPLNTKVVLTVYDMIPELFSNDTQKSIRSKKTKARAVARADHVICISEQTKQDLIKILNVDPSKISVVHLGFTLTQSSGQTHLNIKPLRPFLLYVGHRGGYKNFEGLLKAYASSSELVNRFDLLCFGGGPFTNQEIERIKGFGINPNQIYQVSGDDSILAAYYKAASVFVYPSLYEGFGIPPLEAMSFDCPVVCSNTSSIPEVVGNAAEMFDPTNTESIITAIEHVVNNELYRENLIELGRERIKQFSWERCARQTLDIYRKILA